MHNATLSCNNGTTSCGYEFDRHSAPPDDKASQMNLTVFYNAGEAHDSSKVWDLNMTSTEHRDGYTDYTGTTKCYNNQTDGGPPKPTECDKQVTVTGYHNILHFDPYDPDLSNHQLNEVDFVQDDDRRDIIGLSHQ